ncbi:hypothetical protein [Streptomyces bohaiensis]|uniref:RNHCP domain-containing protein n=1 Tax=Streptomyces bohaiensis TaxID=1431344 RepID=A0ABX1C2Q0_9ACTN|nr:hypothetical protein [Streptomyces bohaiensis]NJQ13514.1 hypothetical protein [Streptomyces bohaiensis]
MQNATTRCCCGGPQHQTGYLDEGEAGPTPDERPPHCCNARMDYRVDDDGAVYLYRCNHCGAEVHMTGGTVDQITHR